MTCFCPIPAYQCEDGTVVFSERSGHGSVRSLELPCGRCIGCRLERSRQWAVRCMHEASLYDCNVFVTLSYSDEFLPGPSLVYRDFQLFMKRLRRSRPGTPVRFFMCGEYGEQTRRPHYHAILFNCFFADRRDHGVSPAGFQMWVSEELDRLWGLGHCWIGTVTFQSAGYISRYCVKKVTGDMADEHYKVVDLVTGKVHQIEPEFMRCSLKPGIGEAWFRKYGVEQYAAYKGACVTDGHLGKVPRYYDGKAEEFDSDLSASVAFDRRQFMLARGRDDSPERLAVREEVKERQARMLTRRYEK